MENKWTKKAVAYAEKNIFASHLLYDTLPENEDEYKKFVSKCDGSFDDAIKSHRDVTIVLVDGTKIDPGMWCWEQLSLEYPGCKVIHNVSKKVLREVPLPETWSETLVWSTAPIPKERTGRIIAQFHYGGYISYEKDDKTTHNKNNIFAWAYVARKRKSDPMYGS